MHLPIPLSNPNAFQGNEVAHAYNVKADLLNEQPVIAATEGTDTITANLPLVFDLEATALQYSVTGPVAVNDAMIRPH